MVYLVYYPWNVATESTMIGLALIIRPKCIKDLGFGRKLRDQVVLGKTICCLSKNEVKQHWMIRGILSTLQTKMFGYYEYQKKRIQWL